MKQRTDEYTIKFFLILGIILVVGNILYWLAASIWPEVDKGY